MTTQTKAQKQKATIAARVHTLTTAGLADDEYRSKAEIAKRLGWSEDLVTSTINRINEYEAADPEAMHVLVYSQDHGGWKLGAAWAQDKAYYVAWLARHIETRIRSAVRHVEVAVGLLPDSPPKGLLASLGVLVVAVEAVRDHLPAGKAPDPKIRPRRRRVKLIP